MSDQKTFVADRLLQNTPFDFTDSQDEDRPMTDFNPKRCDYIRIELDTASGQALRDLHGETDSQKIHNQLYHAQATVLNGFLEHITEPELTYLLVYIGMQVKDGAIILENRNKGHIDSWFPTSEGETEFDCCPESLIAGNHNIHVVKNILSEYVVEYAKELCRTHKEVEQMEIYQNLRDKMLGMFSELPEEKGLRSLMFTLGRYQERVINLIEEEVRKSAQRTIQRRSMPTQAPHLTQAVLRAVSYNTSELLAEWTEPTPMASIPEANAMLAAYFGISIGMVEQIADLCSENANQLVRDYQKGMGMDIHPVEPTAAIYYNSQRAMLTRHFPMITCAEAMFIQHVTSFLYGQVLGRVVPIKRGLNIPVVPINPDILPGALLF